MLLDIILRIWLVLYVSTYSFMDHNEGVLLQGPIRFYLNKPTGLKGISIMSHM